MIRFRLMIVSFSLSLFPSSTAPLSPCRFKISWLVEYLRISGIGVAGSPSSYGGCCSADGLSRHGCIAENTVTMEINIMPDVVLDTWSHLNHFISNCLQQKKCLFFKGQESPRQLVWSHLRWQVSLFPYCIRSASNRARSNGRFKVFFWYHQSSHSIYFQSFVTLQAINNASQSQTVVPHSNLTSFTEFRTGSTSWYQYTSVVVLYYLALQPRT